MDSSNEGFQWAVIIWGFNGGFNGCFNGQF